MKMKKTFSTLLALTVVLSASGCNTATLPERTTTAATVAAATTTAATEAETMPKYQKYASMTAEEIVATLTLDQKAAQMVQPAIYAVSESDMQKYCYRSILSKYNSVTYKEWQSIVDGFQQKVIDTDAGIPYLYGQDDVHGVNYCDGAVLFPHNIGIGAANDPELTYQMGLATADEAKLCHMLWNFAPCVAQSEDPRWGRTYESCGADLSIIENLGAQYTKGLLMFM